MSRRQEPGQRVPPDWGDDIVITGSGLICGLGTTPADVWCALEAGKRAIGPLTGYGENLARTERAAQVPEIEFQALGIPRRDARIMRKHGLMLMKVALDAFKEAGLAESGIPAEEIGLFAGLGMVDCEPEDLVECVLECRDENGGIDFERFYAGSYRRIYPLWPLSMLSNMALCQVAIRLNVRGENAVFSPHNNAGVMAIVEAVQTVREGRARAVLAGGASEKVNPFSLARARNLGIIGPRLQAESRSTPGYANEGTGSALGEGAAMLVLEARSNAIRRGARFHARVAGNGWASASAGEKGDLVYSAVAAAMENAIGKADLEPQDIDVVMSQGSDDPGCEGWETEAIRRVFGGSGENLSVLSTRSSTGNLLAASPAVDAVLAACMAAEGRARNVLINSRSPEGQCASLIISRCVQ